MCYTAFSRPGKARPLGRKLYEMSERLPGVQWTKPVRLTVSSAHDLDCGRKFSELRVKRSGWGPKREFPPSVGRGSAVHDTLRSLHAGVSKGELPLGDLDTMAREATWRARFNAGTDREAEAAKVSSAVRLFLKNQDEEDLSAIVALETQIEFDYIFKGKPLACVSGTVDRIICRRPDQLVVQDYKTTVQKISLRECFILLWCSKVRWPGYKEYLLELIWIDVEDGQVTVDTITTDMVRGQHRIITALLLRALTNEPVAEEGPQCTFCPIRGACLGGLAAVNDDGEMEIF